MLSHKKYHRPLLFHSGLWLLSFVILTFVFSKGETPITADYIYTLIFLGFVTFPVLINFYVLIPTFLKKEQYGLYIVSFVGNTFLFCVFSILFFKTILDILFPNYFFVSYLTPLNIITIYAIFLVATTLLKLAEDWFYFNTEENNQLKLKNQHIETQLSSLRAQINPHFLFNSLNVIYSLALDKKEDITHAIVQLSDILRYVIYDSDTERVCLKDEIKLLQNYIAFQNYKLAVANAVQFNFNIETETFKIYPMLLLPLLENSYKHGILANEQTKPIIIEMFQKGHHFKFNISNANSNSKNAIDDAYSGVGLENLRNNLSLVYPNQHELIIEETQDHFIVNLNITDQNAEI